MNLKQLETFHWAAKLGSFTAAAERLNATQSTVSMRIQELESDLGVALFDRSQRMARITPKGRELMRYAEQMLNLVTDMRERVSEPEAIPGLVRVGITEVISITWLPKLVKAIHQLYPRIRLELDEALTKDLVEKLQSDALDLILAPGRLPGYTAATVSLGTVEFAWMASRALALPDRALHPQELQHWPVIALSRESHHHTTIEDWFRSGNAYCHRIDTCKSMNVAASLAAAGLGVTLLPVRCYRRETEAGRLRIIKTVPKMPAVEFTATCSIDSIHPIARRFALLAQKVSDFERGPRSRKQPGSLERAST